MHYNHFFVSTSDESNIYVCVLLKVFFILAFWWICACIWLRLWFALPVIIRNLLVTQGMHQDLADSCKLETKHSWCYQIDSIHFLLILRTWYNKNSRNKSLTPYKNLQNEYLKENWWVISWKCRSNKVHKTAHNSFTKLLQYTKEPLRIRL